jgi:hypothetical protein
MEADRVWCRAAYCLSDICTRTPTKLLAIVDDLCGGRERAYMKAVRGL